MEMPPAPFPLRVLLLIIAVPLLEMPPPWLRPEPELLKEVLPERVLLLIVMLPELKMPPPSVKQCSPIKHGDGGYRP